MMSLTETRANSRLPDPDYHAEFYTDVPAKRLIAWFVDIALITVIVGVLTFLGFLLPLFFLPVLYFCVSFLYRWGTIAAGSATPGMRFVAIELRDRDGLPLDATSAFLHTAGYAVSVLTVPLQLFSIILMLMTPRRQGLTDIVLGTAAVNRPTR